MMMAEGTKFRAQDISEAILEITGDALLSQDFDAFFAVFHVPQYMATMAGPIFMETRADMERAFAEMSRYFKEAGITKLDREITESRYVNENKIESTHVATTYRGNEVVKGPYPVFSVIEWIDGTWKVTGSEYVLEPDCDQAIALARADASARVAEE